jgi:hypothetical protein
MRQRAFTSLYVAALVVACAAAASAQMGGGNPRGEAKLTLAGKSIAVDYGRPSLKGRDMLGKAEVGQEWRMGADAPTTLKTSGALRFGATEVPAGEYVLRAKKVSDTDWTLKFEKDGKAVAEVPLQAGATDGPVEVFTIDLAEDKGQGVFRLSWGDRALSARFTAAK